MAWEMLHEVRHPRDGHDHQRMGPHPYSRNSRSRTDDIATELARTQAGLVQRLKRRPRARVLHHRQQNASGDFRVRLGVMVVELVAHVGGQGPHLGVRQVRPDASAQPTGTKIIKLRTGQAEMIQRGLKHAQVKRGIVRNHEVSTPKLSPEHWSNGPKSGGVLNITPGQTAAVVREFFRKPAMPFGRPHRALGYATPAEWYHRPPPGRRLGAIRLGAPGPSSPPFAPLPLRGSGAHSALDAGASGWFYGKNAER